MCETDIARFVAEAYAEITLGGPVAMRPHLLTYFSFAALALSCAGGQSGDLSGNNDGGEGTLGGQCEEHKQKLGGFDEPTEAGTAEQILAFAERSFEAPLSWKTAQSGAWELSATG